MKTFIAVGLTALLASAAPAVAQMQPPTPLSATEFASAAVGSRVSIAVRVDARARSVVRAELLDRETDERYRATGARVELYQSGATPVVMGTAADVRPGAVAIVTAVVTGKRRADLKRIIILTQYVSVH
ncbi:MAG: hypothetical protein JWO85_3003 [Candidatus Eremiobacteraeota bacterium]|jgi:hypothetical protein|nr:hypothetical protein [Candidatus Eremiobacteraeota bacterium]